MNVIYCSVNVDKVVMILRGGGDTLPLHMRIEVA